MTYNLINIVRILRFEILNPVSVLTRLIYESYRVPAIIIISTGIVQAVIPLVSALIIKNMFDILNMISENSREASLSLLFPLLVLQIIVSVLGSIVAPIATYYESSLGLLVSKDVQLKMLAKVNSLEGLSSFENPQLYDTIRVVSRGVEVAPQQLIRVVNSTLISLLTILGFITILFSFNPLLGTLIFISVLPQLYINYKIVADRMRLFAKISPIERRVGYLSQQMVNPSAAKEIRLYNFGKYLIDILDSMLSELKNQKIRQSKWILGRQIVLSLPTSLLSAVSFVIAVFQVIEGRFSIGDIALYSVAATTMYSALANISSAIAEFGEGLSYMSRFEKFLNEPQDLPILEPALEAKSLKYAITLNQVSFRYSDDQNWILKNISFKIQKGQSVAIIGLNGAGKTTLIKLLTRMYDPTSGYIAWDEYDIRQFQPQKFRDNFSVVFQDYGKYDLTARENIGIGHVDMINDLSAISRVAHSTGINTVLKSLSHSYETILSRQFSLNSTGTDLSGGEWQRVAIARALIGNRDVLILDEPTSSLDPETESKLFSNIDSYLKGKTIIMITHRLSLASSMDTIIVLDQGQITEMGTHSELIGMMGKYATMYNAQAKQYS